MSDLIPAGTSDTLETLQEKTFRDEVTIRNPTSVSKDNYATPDGSGYQDVATVDARVNLEEPDDQEASGRREQQQVGTVVMNSRTDVSEDTRFVWTDDNGQTLILEVVGTEYIGVRQNQMNCRVVADRLSGDFEL